MPPRGQEESVIPISVSPGSSDLSSIRGDLLDSLLKVELNPSLLVPGWFVKDQVLLLGSPCEEIGKPNPGVVGKGLIGEDIDGPIPVVTANLLGSTGSCDPIAHDDIALHPQTPPNRSPDTPQSRTPPPCRRPMQILGNSSNVMPTEAKIQDTAPLFPGKSSQRDCRELSDHGGLSFSREIVNYNHRTNDTCAAVG